MVAAFAPISDTLLRRRRRIGKSTVNGVMYVTLKVFNGTLYLCSLGIDKHGLDTLIATLLQCSLVSSVHRPAEWVVWILFKSPDDFSCREIAPL